MSYREGIQFYTNFQEILNQFAAKCNDFVIARQTEKQDLLGFVTSDTITCDTQFFHIVLQGN
jgi:hypothetical protein